MSNILKAASSTDIKFGGIEFEGKVNLSGKPYANATLSVLGGMAGDTARGLDIYPDNRNDDRGVASFTVYSIEEAEYIVEQFTIAFNEEYKMAIWKAARDSFKESKSL